MKTKKNSQKRCIGDVELLKRSGNTSIVFVYLQPCAKDERATQITVTFSMINVSRLCAPVAGSYVTLRL